MKKKLIIIGSGGHGRVCAEIAELNGYLDISFLDDNNNNSLVIGPTEDYYKYIDVSDFFIAIGNNKIRSAFIKKIYDVNGKLATLIHPDSIISKNTEIGPGTVVIAGAVINIGALIGKGVIINTSSSVDHDSRVGDYVNLSVGVHIAGNVNIGDEVFIGSGATVINNISICSGAIIGAGAVVINNITENGTYVGVPARKNL